MTFYKADSYSHPCLFNCCTTKKFNELLSLSFCHLHFLMCSLPPILPMVWKWLQVASFIVSALVNHNTSTDTNDDSPESPPGTPCTAIHGWPLLRLHFNSCPLQCSIIMPTSIRGKGSRTGFSRKRTANNIGHCTITTPVMEPNPIVNWPIKLPSTVNCHRLPSSCMLVQVVTEMDSLNWRTEIFSDTRVHNYFVL